MWLLYLLFAAMLTFVGTFRAFVPQVALDPAPAPIIVGAEEQQILKLINDLRASHGVGPLSYDVRLERVGDTRATQLPENGPLIHENYEELGIEQGITGGVFGENLARASSIEYAWELFLGSPSHYENFNRPGWLTVGIGIEHRGGTVYIAIEFHALTLDPPYS